MVKEECNEMWRDDCKVIGSNFAVMRDDTIIEADSVDELIEKIRVDAKSRGAVVWITRAGKKIPIKNGRMPNGADYMPKRGSIISVRGAKGVINYVVVSGGTFKRALDSAKPTVDKTMAWRVDDTHSISDYKGDKLFKTAHGSTIAVTHTGDIISVCKKTGDKASGSDLLKMAVAQGGKKLDSFCGNYDFYVKNGFEPVRWTPFNKEYAPHDWKEGRDKPEPIIFFQYTGKVTKMDCNEFLHSVKASKEYDDAMSIRDNAL